MKRFAAKWLLSIVVVVLIWTFGDGAGLKLSAVGAEPRPPAGLSQLETEIAAALRSRSEQMNIDYTGDAKELSGSIKQTIRQALAQEEYTAYIVDSYFYSIRTWNGVSRIKLAFRFTPRRKLLLASASAASRSFDK